MSQEAIEEIDMDVFSRRIKPYFSWLESKMESSWEQNENVEKDVLKEVKYLATTMRARFILGVSKSDFKKEVDRTLNLFDLATEAFPDQEDEIETKQKHFSKGVSEELGPQFLPNSPRPPEPPDPHPAPEPRPEPVPVPPPIPEPEPEPSPEPEPQERIKVEVKVAKQFGVLKKLDVALEKEDQIKVTVGKVKREKPKVKRAKKVEVKKVVVRI